MTTSHIDLNGFIVAQFEGQSRWIKTATDGLSDDQLHYRPTADSNSIAWLIWHLSRWRRCRWAAKDFADCQGCRLASGIPALSSVSYLGLIL